MDNVNYKNDGTSTVAIATSPVVKVVGFQPAPTRIKFRVGELLSSKEKAAEFAQCANSIRNYRPPICNAETFVCNLGKALADASAYQRPIPGPTESPVERTDWQIVLNTENRRIELATDETYGFDPETSFVLISGNGLGQLAITYPTTTSNTSFPLSESFGERHGRKLAFAAMLDLRCNNKSLTEEASTIAIKILTQVLTDMDQTTFPFAGGAACNAIV